MAISTIQPPGTIFVAEAQTASQATSEIESLESAASYCTFAALT